MKSVAPLPFGQEPNVVGHLYSHGLGSVNKDYENNWKGCIKIQDLYENTRNSEIVSDLYKLTHDADIDASKSNSIFGASQKVQPKSYQALIIIKA